MPRTQSAGHGADVPGAGAGKSFDMAYGQSDTPGEAGGLMSVTASKAVVLLNRQSGISREAIIRNALDNQACISASQCLYGGHVRHIR